MSTITSVHSAIQAEQSGAEFQFDLQHHEIPTQDLTRNHYSNDGVVLHQLCPVEPHTHPTIMDPRHEYPTNEVQAIPTYAESMGSRPTTPNNVGDNMGVRSEVKSVKSSGAKEAEDPSNNGRPFFKTFPTTVA